MTVASGARYRSATRRASAIESAGSRGPSLLTVAATSRSAVPSPGGAASPTTTPIAWRPPRPNGTSTASPASRPSIPGGRA